MAEGSTLSTPVTARRNFGWLRYLIGLSLVVAAIVAAMIFYSFAQQLTLQQVENAYAKWRSQGTANYEMQYTLRHGVNETIFFVWVRDGKIIKAERNDEPQSDVSLALTMDDLFDRIETDLKTDSESGHRQWFSVATFHKSDGRVTHYLRRKMGTGELIEYEVKLGRTTPEGKPIR